MVDRQAPVSSASTDEQLVDAIVGGDQAAFTLLYDRYADRVYSFCLTLTRDRGLAEDVVSDTFVAAWRNFDRLRDRTKVRPFLFRIARNRLARVGERAARQVPVDPEGEVMGSLTTLDDADARVDAEVGGALDGDQAVALVWDAAEGLNENERAVLELSVRQGLEGEELAAAMGVTRHNATVIASRMRTNLERSIGALYLVRHDGRRCPELRSITVAYDGEFTTVWRKRIARHVDGCEYCQIRARSSAMALFAASPVATAPPELRGRIIQRTFSVVHAFIKGSRALESDGNGDSVPGDRD